MGIPKTNAKRRYLVTFHVKAEWKDGTGVVHDLANHYVERLGHDADSVYNSAALEFPGCISKVYPDTEYNRKRLAAFRTTLIDITGARR